MAGKHFIGATALALAVLGTASSGGAKTSAPNSPAVSWARIITGSWVSSSGPLVGGPHDNCETDVSFWFGADGSYGTDTNIGHWRLSGDTVVATVTAANPDGDIGPPMKRLAKPILIRSRLLRYKAPVLVAITDGEKEYWYRCPKWTDAGR